LLPSLDADSVCRRLVGDFHIYAIRRSSMNGCWSTLAVLAALLAAVVPPGRAAADADAPAPQPSSPAGGGRRPAVGGTGSAALDAVLAAKIAELEKLGVTADDVVRYIWRLREAEPRRLGDAAAASSPSGWPRAAADRRRVSDASNLLVRHFVRNRTVACNDGSPAG